MKNSDKRISAIASELGKKGGKSTLKKLGKKHYKKISKIGVAVKKLRRAENKLSK